jgi:predicted lipoprotein with Yx(FWY)xxD motif
MKNSRLTFISVVVVVLGVAVLLLAAGGSARKTRPAAGVVAVKHTALGNILVGAGGRSLYLFLADRPNVSTLSRAGLKVWPAFLTTGAPKTAGAASAAKISTITTDARRQITYGGHPLYYFVGDQQAGSTTGQGLLEFGARWYVVSPNGNAIKSAPATAAPTTSESSGGSFRY